MSFYDIDYQQFIRLMLPTKKRLPKWIAWLYSLIKPIQWVRDAFFTSYIGGNYYSDFSSLFTYSLGDRVVWLDNSVYECMNPTPTVGSVSSPILKPEYWYKMQENFIGLNERMRYNAQIIVLETALNRWFKVAGEDPQIYIVDNTINGNQLLISNTSEDSGTLAVNSIFSDYYMGASYASSGIYDYSIMFPLTYYNALGTSGTARQNRVRSFVDLYNVAGIQYNILTY